ncbi:hypothetical protein ACTFIW_001874 [Dictyostelium discoideum]
MTNNKNKNENESNNQMEPRHTKKKQKTNHNETKETIDVIIEKTTTTTTIHNLENLNIEELNKFKQTELLEIVKSFSNKTNNRKKKSELIEILKEEIENRKLLIQENENNIKNNNPFNKNFKELLIKDVDNKELLFWKIFRNKVLFKNIISKFEFKHFSQNYDSMISIHNLLANDKISIVKDKVNNNCKYLVFTPSSYGTSTTITTTTNLYLTFSIIFSKFQTDDLDTYNFFKNLFKNYGDKFFEELKYIKFINGDGNDDSDDDDRYFCSTDFIRTIIIYNCVPAVKVLMNEFNFIPTVDNFFKKVVGYGSLAILKFLLINDENQERRNKLISQLKSKKSHLQIWREISPPTLFQSFYGPLNINYKIEKFKTISFLLENNYLKIPQKNEDLYDIKVSLYSTSPITNYLLLKDLILSCKLLNQLLNNNNNNNSINNTNNNSYYDEIIKKFTNKQLESMLKDLINWELNENENKQIIKDLLNYWYRESGTSKIDYEFYLCFDKLENDKEIRSVHKTNFILALQYGNFEILMKSVPNRFGLKEFERTVITYDIDIQHKPNYLFTHCNNKEKQKEFISSWIQYIDDNNNNNNNDSSGSGSGGGFCLNYYYYYIFLILIQNDDIELLKFSINKLPLDKLIINFEKHNNIIISDYIKSVEMLEFLYKEYGSNNILKPCLQIFLLHLSNLELLKCFEKLENLSSKRRIVLLEDSVKKCVFNLPMVSHIIKNVENIYEIKEFAFKGIFNDIDENQIDELINLLQYIVKFTDIKINTFFNYYYTNFILFTKIPNFKILKFIDWLISINYPIINDGFFCENKLKIFKYLVGRIQEIDEFFPDKWINSGGGNIYPLAKFIVLKCDLDALDFIMKEINNSNKAIKNDDTSNFIFILLGFASEIGQLKILEHIKLHHCQLFNKKSKSGGWFSQIQLNSLINKSIISNHINCTEFLLQYSTISQSQFKKITAKSGISYTYFKNKIK